MMRKRVIFKKKRLSSILLKFISVNIADSYGCGNNDGVTGCKSDGNGVSIVCHCDTELCNSFHGDAGKNVATNLVFVAAFAAFFVLTRNH